MAQRVFLIRMPIGVLERTAASICGDATARAAMAAELATTGAPHLRRVTVSEMVVNAAERTGALSSDWLTAHNCMPFLIAAKQAEQICEALRIVEGLKEPGELEDFFTEQARTLDMKSRYSTATSLSCPKRAWSKNGFMDSSIERPLCD